MPINIPLGYGVVTFHFSSVGFDGEAVCTLGIDRRASTQTTQEDVEQISDSYVASVHTRALSATRLTNVTAIFTTAGGPQSIEVPQDTGGALSGKPLPPNTAILVQKLTGYAGKKNRGRLFWPNCPDAITEGINPSLIADASVSAMQVTWDTFRTDLVTFNLLPVILHQQGVADPPRLVTSFVVQKKLATQRGRLRD